MIRFGSRLCAATVLAGLAALGSSILGPGLPASAAPTRASASASGWHFSKLYHVPHMSGAVNGLACPTTKECVAVSSNDVFWTKNATGGKKTWHHYALEPSTLPYVQGSIILNDISCPSIHFCVVADDAGNVFVTGNPTSGKTAWAGHSVDDIELLTLDCSAAATCAGIDYNGRLLSTANPTGSWVGASASLDSNPELWGVSCAGKTLCAAVSGTSKIATTVNPGGSAPAWQVKKVKGAWDDVSCPTTSKCVAVGGYLATHGRVAVSTSPAHGSWKTASLSKTGPNKIDCASATHCFADNDYSTTHVAAKTSAWKFVTVSANDSQTAVSCPTTARCYLGTSTDRFSVGKR